MFFDASARKKRKARSTFASSSSSSSSFRLDVFALLWRNFARAVYESRRCGNETKSREGEKKTVEKESFPPPPSHNFGKNEKKEKKDAKIFFLCVIRSIFFVSFLVNIFATFLTCN